MSPVNQFWKTQFGELKNASICIVKTTVEPRFNKVLTKGDIYLVISSVRYIENPDLTNFFEKKQNVRYIEI